MERVPSRAHPDAPEPNVPHHPITPTKKPTSGAAIHLMLTCLCDAFYTEAGISAVNCLEAAGYTVIFDERQTCCSQPAFNSGDWEAARRAARHTLHVFDSAEAVVTPSGSCAAMIRWGYPQLFDGEPEQEAAQRLAAKTWEFSEFLCEVARALPWPGSYTRRVTLHQSCHSRELAFPQAPWRLLQSIKGLELALVDSQEQCCGFGGIFSVAFPWTSSAIGHTKLDAIARARPDEIVYTDMGCMMHLDGLRRRAETPVPMRHIAQLLDEARQ